MIQPAPPKQECFELAICPSTMETVLVSTSFANDMLMTETGNSRIRDLPMELRPREKLLQHGASTLSDAELLAIFIATGTRGTSAIQLGQRIMERWGSLTALGSLPATELAKELGMGTAKASRLVAAFELGCRVSRESIHSAPLDSPERIHASFAPRLQHLPHEQVLVAALDCRLRHLSTTLVSSGSVDESIAHPRDILRPVVSRGAHGFVLIHNHPSGDPSPSRADHSVTQRVDQAAQLLQLRFVDHLIVGRPQSGRQPWFSFREAGRLGG